MKTPHYQTVLAVAIAAFAVGACSDSDDNTPDDTGGVSVGESESGTPAEQASELEIRQKAAFNASQALAINLDDAFSTRFDESDLGEEIDDAENVDQEVDGFMQAALGLDGNNAVVEREGNLITIDLDDNAICDAALADRASFIADYDECLQLAQHFQVQVDAVTDDTGRIHFQFQEQSVLSIGYAPSAGSYEFSLPGFYQMTRHIADLRGITGSVPEIITGALLVQAELDSASETASAASLSLNVSQALHIADSSNNIDISIAPSEIVGFRSNDDGSVAVSTNMGAINLLFEASTSDSVEVSTNGDVEVVMTETTEPVSFALSIAAISAHLDIAADGQSAQVSNAGFGSSPLSLQVDGEQTLSLSLNDVSMTLSPETLAFDSDMTLGVMLGNTLSASLIGQDPELGNASVSGSIAIPAATSMSEQDNGSTRVDSGSVSIQVTATGASGSSSQSFDASAGQCFDSDDDDSDDIGMLQVVDCE